MKLRFVPLLLVCLFVAVACGAEPTPEAGDDPTPSPHASPMQTAIQPPPPGSGTGQAALTWTVPEGWLAEPPGTSMRKAQYRVPGPGGDAECVVFYFGPGQGGGARANAERWAGQFTLPDGRPGSAEMQLASRKVGDIEVLTVSVSGTYQGGFRMQQPPEPALPDHMLLGAVAQGSDANWFFKLTGPEATVAAQRAAFDGMIASLARGPAQP